MRCVRFSPRGDRIVTCGDDGTRLWSRNGEHLLSYHEPGPAVNSAAFSALGDRLIESRFDGTARVLLTDPEELLQRAQQRVAFRALTESELEAYGELLRR